VEELITICHGNLSSVTAELSRLPDLDQKLTAAYHKKVFGDVIKLFYHNYIVL